MCAPRVCPAFSRPPSAPLPAQKAAVSALRLRPCRPLRPWSVDPLLPSFYVALSVLRPSVWLFPLREPGLEGTGELMRENERRAEGRDGGALRRPPAPAFPGTPRALPLACSGLLVPPPGTLPFPAALPVTTGAPLLCVSRSGTCRMSVLGRETPPDCQHRDHHQLQTGSCGHGVSPAGLGP